MLTANPNRRPARRWVPLAAIAMMGSVAVISAGFDPGMPETTAVSPDIRLETPPAVAPVAATPVTVTQAGTAPAAVRTALAAAPAAAAAQAGQATLYGRIVDPSGAVLPGVEVSAARAGETDSRRAFTDASGFYQLQKLSAGDYTVQTRLPGFTSTRVVVAVSETGSIEHSLQLDLGSLEETITVVAERGAFRPARDPAVRTAPAPRQIAAPKILKDVAAPSAAPGTPVRVGGAIKAPAKVLDVRPVYPAAAQAAGVEGIVALDAVIDANGSVKTVDVRRNSEPDLTSAAVEAVRGWKFTPTLLNGQPVDVQMAVTVNFVLK